MPIESDWKTFSKMVPELRERYLREKNAELIAILQAPDKTSTEQFWDAEEHCRKEAKILRYCLIGHSRSKMYLFMGSMLKYGMLRKEDLEPFSEELRAHLTHWLREE